jgi:hypothetical protein
MFNRLDERRSRSLSTWAVKYKPERDNDYQKALVPNALAVEKIIRYQNAIERQLSRAYQWLYTLQQIRLGKSAPASLLSGPALGPPPPLGPSERSRRPSSDQRKNPGPTRTSQLNCAEPRPRHRPRFTITAFEKSTLQSNSKEHMVK